MLDINRKPARFTKKAWAAFVRMVDLATPAQRRLLDRLERVRPDMGPLKLRGYLYNPVGVYGRMGRRLWRWINKEVRDGEAELERERRQEIEAAIGAGI